MKDLPDTIESLSLYFTDLLRRDYWEVVARYLVSERSTCLRQLGLFVPPIQWLCDVLPAYSHENLRCLKVASSTPIDVSALIRAERLVQGLRELDLSGNGLTDEGIQALAEVEGLQLRHLDLSRNLIGPEGIGKLAEGDLVGSLQSLNLSDNPVTDRGVELLGTLPRTRLESLKLGGAQLSDSSCRLIATNTCFENLVRLELPVNAITDSGARILAQSPLLSNLEVLDLAVNPIGAAGVEAISRSESLTRLRDLNLNGAECQEMSTEAITALARSPSLRRVEKLDLSHRPLTDAGIEEMTGHGT